MRAVRHAVRPSGGRGALLARCALALALAAAGASRPAGAIRLLQQPPTFTRDVAPIIFKHCVACHRPGEPAPFSLLTYADVRRRARQIVEVTRSRVMPPWSPAAGFGGPFVGERRLSEDEIATLAAWVEHGATEGERADLLPVALPAAGWRLGTPDLVLTLPEAYTLAPDGPDVFRNFVVPVPIDGTKYVAAVEFRPGSRVAHHANLRIDRTRSSRDRDAQDPRPGYQGPISPHAQYPDGHFLGWTPGQLTPRAAPGMAWRLEPGSDLVIQIHMRPSGRPETIRPSVGLFFTSDPPGPTPVMLRLGRQRIDIPSGEPRYVTQDSYRLPVDVHVLGVQPHAHFRAKDVKGFATLPDGPRRWLVFIPQWDFNWQDVYRFADPLFLPKGTIVSLEWTYDNSAANPRNPDTPPRRVLYGQNSTDEMGDLWIQVLPATPHERETLFEDFRPKLLAEDAGGYETMLRGDPRNAELHRFVALLYWDLGKVDQAIGHYEAAIGLEPGDAKTRYNLATLLSQHGRLDEAAAHLRDAIRLEPDNAAAHNNLAAVLAAQARFEDAVRHFAEAARLEPESAVRHNNLGQALVLSGRAEDGIPSLRESLRLDPELGDAHLNLARALQAQGHVELAAGHYREALRVTPDWPAALADLARLLATATNPQLRQPDESIRLSERAVALTRRQNIDALDALGAAYAAAGLFHEAVAAVQTALDLAAADAPQMIDRLRSRLESYRRDRR